MLWTVLSVALAVQAGDSATGTKRALAVMPLQTKSLPANKVAILDTILVTAVAELNLYRVVSSADVNAMLGLDKMKQAIGCNDLSCAAELGGALGVDYLLITTVDSLGGSLLLTSSLLDIRNTQAVARRKVKVKDQEDVWVDAVEQLITETFGASKPSPSAAKPATSVTSSEPAPPTPGVTSTGPYTGVSDGGRVTLTSDLPGRILLDGIDVGHSTPYVLRGVPPGTHVFTVDAVGKRGEATLEVTPNGDHTLNVTLGQTVTGTIRVDAAVAGAVASLDGKVGGPVPHLFTDVPAGKHEVEVSMFLYESWEQEVELKENSTVDVDAKLLQRKPFSLGVNVSGAFFNWNEVGCTTDMTATPPKECSSSNGMSIAPAAELKWFHHPLLAARGRIGLTIREDPEISDGSDGSTAGVNDSGGGVGMLLAVGEEFLFPLLHDEDPIPTVANRPLGFIGGVDGELLLGGGPVLARIVGRIGIRAYWLTAAFNLGFQGGSHVSGSYPTGSGTPATTTSVNLAADAFFIGFNAGLMFAF